MDEIERNPIQAAIPIACTLTADERTTWRDGMGGTVLGGYEEARELPDGYALRFPGDERWAQTLLGFVLHERECCRFFTFGLVFEPDQGAIWLHLSGSAEIKAVVKGMIQGAERI